MGFFGEEKRAGFFLEKQKLLDNYTGGQGKLGTPARRVFHLFGVFPLGGLLTVGEGFGKMGKL